MLRGHYRRRFSMLPLFYGFLFVFFLLYASLIVCTYASHVLEHYYDLFVLRLCWLSYRNSYNEPVSVNGNVVKRLKDKLNSNDTQRCFLHFSIDTRVISLTLVGSIRSKIDKSGFGYDFYVRSIANEP